jgi:sugar phosphate isomerase/epimerase
MTLSTAAGAAALTASFSRSAFSGIPATDGYRLMILATNWGFSGDWEQFAEKISTLGYDGAEVWYPHDPAHREAFLKSFEKRGLKFGFLVGGSDNNPNKHLAQFTESLEEAIKYQPVYVNCHSGRDYFSIDENQRFIALTTRTSLSSGIPIYHETHRSRILYSAPVARMFMERNDLLELTLDISHWCNVHESLLADQPETVELALRRTGHIHARIGHAEGPQVGDPRAPEWAPAVAAHLGWWDSVTKRKRDAGQLLTILTEFGPPNYLPTLPYTRQPVADQWDINNHMLSLLRKRYS